MRAIRERLPLESVPAKFVFITQLPLTDTGKIDRRMLLEPERMTEETDVNAIAPRNRIETALAEYWCEILGLPRVGVHDHFMNLGGHSLSVMRLLNRLRANRGIELSVADILDNPTIAKLAERMETLPLTESGTPFSATPSVAAYLSNPASGSLDPLAAATAETVPATVRDFACPKTPSPHFGARHCNLVLFLGDDGDPDSYAGSPARSRNSIRRFRRRLSGQARMVGRAAQPADVVLFTGFDPQSTTHSRLCLCCIR
jgi:aryl carrier-like protein